MKRALLLLGGLVALILIISRKGAGQGTDRANEPSQGGNIATNPAGQGPAQAA